MSPHQNLHTDVKVTKVMNAVAAGTTDQQSSSVDMVGFTSVSFLASFGALAATAVTSCKIQYSDDDSNWSDYTDVDASDVTKSLDADDDGNKGVIISAVDFKHRYARLSIDRGTADAVIDCVFAIQAGAKEKPTTHCATTMLDGSQWF